MTWPWLVTHSAHQPLPHCEQMARDATDGWLAQRRQAPGRGRVEAGEDGRTGVDAWTAAEGVGRAAFGDAAGGRGAEPAVGRVGAAGRAGVLVGAGATGGDGAARGAASAGGASGSAARARDASATSKTVPQPAHRALSPGTSSFSGGTRIARRHFGQSTVM